MEAWFTKLRIHGARYKKQKQTNKKISQKHLLGSKRAGRKLSSLAMLGSHTLIGSENFLRQRSPVSILGALIDINRKLPYRKGRTGKKIALKMY